MKMRMLGILTWLPLAACVPEVRVHLPQIVDDGKPPQGTPSDPPLAR